MYHAHSDADEKKLGLLVRSCKSEIAECENKLMFWNWIGASIPDVEDNFAGKSGLTYLILALVTNTDVFKLGHIVGHTCIMYVQKCVRN